MSAIIIIDCQNEFLTSSGIFGSKFINPDPLIKNINHLNINSNIPCYFIKAIYDNNLDTIDHNQTHSGKRCCEKDSSQSELVLELLVKFAHKYTEIIIKNHYSAFNQTDLSKKLQSH